MVSAQRVKDLPREMPPDLPWIPKWVECEFDFETHRNGPTCYDCSSTIHCTPGGGVVRNCFGWTPYCVNGRCMREPSADCAEVETVTDQIFEAYK